MTLSIHNTTDWPFDRVAGYGKELTAAFKKLVERFPNDMTLKSLAEDVMSGRQQLWLILEGDEFRSFVTTEIKINDYTGHKTVHLVNLAGEGGVDLVPLIGEIEKWAAEQGANEVIPICRIGFRKALEKLGYRIDVSLYRKEIGRAE